MPPKNSNEEFRRVWSLADYGNLDALLALRGPAGAGDAAPGDGRTLFPEGMPTGVSTVIEKGKIKPTPAVQAAAQDILRDPKAFTTKTMTAEERVAQQSLLDKGKSFLGQVFDVSDTWKDGQYLGADNPVESVWDSFLGGVGWFYDRISQVSVAGLSALPGGIRTLSWDEANDVSVGQAGLAIAAINQRNLEQGGTQGIGGVLGSAVGMMTGGVIGQVAAMVSPDLRQKIGSPDFDITNAQDRKIFEEDPLAKWSSGITDAVFTIAADPFIVGGKALKFTRLKFVDRPLTPRNMQSMVAELDEAKQLAQTGDVQSMAPIGRIAYEAVTPRPDGTRMPVRELFLRDEIFFSGNAEGIADALGTLRNGDMNNAVLVMKAGLGDVNALRELTNGSVRASDALIAAETEQIRLRIMQDPSLYKTLLGAARTELDRVMTIADDLQVDRANGKPVSLQEISAAQKNVNDAADRVNAIQDMKLPVDLDRPTQETMSWFAAQISELRANDQWFRKALDDANFAAFASADRGFATNTKVGRFVAKRRAKKARAAYERKSVSGQKYRSTDFFGNSRFKRTIRVWQVMNDETPSYYVNFASNVDQGREAGAFLDTLEYLAGAPIRMTDANGITREVGGIARKDELFKMYTSARALGEDVSKAMLRIQEEIRDDIGLWYGINDDVMKKVMERGVSEYDRLRAEITTSKSGFFLSDEAAGNLKGLNIAPFLETQLSNGQYFLPWDRVEQIAKNVKAGKVKNPQEGALFTPGQNATQRVLAANDLFQDFWRPLVLFRLGYPQRNVAEGLFRSMAFESSLMPLLYAGKAGVASVQNFRRVQRAARKAGKAKRQVEEPDAARDRFDALAAAQKELHDREGILRGAAVRMGQLEQERVAALTPPARDIAPSVRDAGRGAFINAEKTMMIRQETVDINGVPEERFLFFQQDPTDPTRYIKSPGAFKTLDEAQERVYQASLDAFEGRKHPAGPQFDLLAQKGAKARAIKIEPFVDADGVIYGTVDEMNAEASRISQEIGKVTLEIEAYGGRPIPAGLANTKFQKWRDNEVKALNEQIQESVAYEKFYQEWIAAAGLQTDEVIEADLNALLLRQIREQQQMRLSALENDDFFALELYANQSQARRVAHNGSKSQPTNGIVLQSAFGDPRYRDIHWSNMSSDNTIRATLAARASLNDSIIYRLKMKDYVDVNPGMGDQYWQGMASMLRQYSQSALGKKILAGDRDERIARWLIANPAGQKIRDNLDEAYAITQSQDTLPRIGNNLNTATAFVEQVRQGLEMITAGDTAVWKVMMDHPPTPEELKALLQNKPNLSPVVGSISEVEGYEKLLDMWRKGTQKAFQKIGTQVEDAFVRGPFYASRFEQAKSEMVAVIRAQYRDQERIPLELLLTAERNAHRRALKDTKDYLYTIDRRTKLGAKGEIIFPFISAAQNSLTSVGRLIRKDPSLPGVMMLLWQAPTKVGWEDENGNLIIPLPKELIPDGVEDFFGLTGMKNITVAKSSLNVIFPESGFAFVPRPTPLVQAAASELMKNGLFGQFGVEAPPILVSAFGQTDADKLWKYFKDYLYGEEGGISGEMVSYDKLAPPAVARIIQYLRKEGSSQYAYQYAIQARTQDLLWQAGERDEYPTATEIQERTNGIYLLRLLGNLLAFTPPNYESAIQPLIDMQRLYDETYGIEGPMKFNENFGPEMMVLANTETTRNVAGLSSTPVTVRNIKKYDSLIRKIIPSIGQDYDVIGMLVNSDTKDSFYDPSAYRWMQSTNIPGTNQLWRETRSGAESMAESQRQAGWVEYIKFKNQLDALLQQRGLTSYRSAAAADLNAMKNEFIDNMRANPMFEGWRVDWDSQGSSKTVSAVQTLRAALADGDFMSENGGSKTWIQAARYMEKRDLLVRLVKESGVSLANKANQQLQDEWDTFRQQLMNEDIGWANIANRFLRGDDTPDAPGGSFRIGEGYASAAA